MRLVNNCERKMVLNGHLFTSNLFVKIPQKRPMICHKNAQQNTTKTPNDLPQNLKMINYKSLCLIEIMLY